MKESAGYTEVQKSLQIEEEGLETERRSTELGELSWHSWRWVLAS